MKVGERVLRPKLRSAPKDALIIANGFSCREQIAHATKRRALHLAEVIQMAIHEGPQGPRGGCPERRYVQSDAGGPSATELLLLAAGTLVAGGLWYRGKRGEGEQV
jgi:hypothetical protein